MTTGIRREQIRGLERYTLLPGEVGTAALADGAVTTGKILDGTILPEDFSSSVYGSGTTTIDPDDATAHGASTALARTDHQHQFTTAAPSALTKTATSAEGSGATFVRNDHAHATSALPWGVVAYVQVTSAGSVFSVTTTSSQYVLNSVAVDAARLYKVHLNTQGALSGTAEWHINLLVDGTQVGRFFVTESAVTVKSINGVCLWLPTTGSKDLAIQCAEIGGAATFQLQASGTIPGFFWVEDIGLR